MMLCADGLFFSFDQTLTVIEDLLKIQCLDSSNKIQNPNPLPNFQSLLQRKGQEVCLVKACISYSYHSLSNVFLLIPFLELSE